MHMPSVTIGIPTSSGLFALLQCYQCVRAVWCVCLRSHACVNSTYPIAFIAQIPLAVFVYGSQDEAEGMLGLQPMATHPLFFFPF